MREAARDDEFSPVIALLGPTAGGKSALLREFAPDV
jgi:tRNA A37 N6-isopentenylltransferase MiaA